MIDVEVAYATPERQVIVALSLPIGSTAEDAVRASCLNQQFAEIDLTVMAVGIFSKPCQLSQVLSEGDRLEIYRPLANDPKDARRQRAVKNRSAAAKK